MGNNLFTNSVSKMYEVYRCENEVKGGRQAMSPASHTQEVGSELACRRGEERRGSRMAQLLKAHIAQTDQLT